MTVYRTEDTPEHLVSDVYGETVRLLVWVRGRRDIPSEWHPGGVIRRADGSLQAQAFGHRGYFDIPFVREFPEAPE
jgi:hypothetical protein